MQTAQDMERLGRAPEATARRQEQEATEASVPGAWTAAVRISGSLGREESVIPGSPLKI